MTSLRLRLLEGAFAILQLPPEAPVPDWAAGAAFISVTRTSDELSIVCLQERVPAEISSGTSWRCIRVSGRLDLSLVGVLASLADPLAAAGIPLFAISTFDTDHMFVVASDLPRALEAWQQAGHALET
jgi:uncharacterized protein